MMCTRFFSPAFLLCFVALTPASLPAQQAPPGTRPEAMPNTMPGMSMPMPAHPAAATQAPAAPQQPRPNQQDVQPLQVPQDLRNSGASGRAAAARNPAETRSRESLQNSVSQQQSQAGVTPAQASDAVSFSFDTLRTQEQENLEGHTGAAGLPAPELLSAVIARPPMSLDDFLAIAMKTHPTLEQARTLVQQTEAQARQAGLPPNPVVGYNGDHIRGGAYGGGEQGGYIAQQFVLGGKLGLRRDIYRAQTASNAFGVAEQTARVRDDVSQGFYHALSAQAAVVVEQRLVKVALDAAETAHQLANVGQNDAPEVLTAELEAERAKVAFVHVQRTFLAAFSVLAAEAGARNLPTVPLAGELEQPPALDAEQQVVTVLAESPTVKRAQAEVVVAEARVKDARREKIPDLTVKAGEWNSGELIESARRLAGPETFVDAGINLPLWNRNQGNIDTAKVQLERARNEVARTQLMLQSEAEPIAQMYLASRFEAERYRTELLPRARRAFQLSVMKYQQMAQPYAPVLLSQRTLFELQRDYLQALESEWTNALALQNYTLMHGLEMPMNSASGNNNTRFNLPTGGSQ